MDFFNIPLIMVLFQKQLQMNLIYMAIKLFVYRNIIDIRHLLKRTDSDWYNRQISTYKLKHKMVDFTKIILFIVLITPIVISTNCTAATASICGAKGGDCQYYNYVNGTCLAPTNCPVTGSTVTVWSNASFNCVPCSGSSKAICESSCSKYNFYFDNNTRINSCTTCQAEYGTFCASCDSSVCKSCSNETQLSTDKLSCVDPVCNISYCKTCDGKSCTVCDQAHIVYQGICVCSTLNCQICAISLCYKCQAGFNLDASRTKCTLKCMDHCLSCNSSSSCTTCAEGYFYNVNSNRCRPNCTLIDAGCVSCSTTTICSECRTNLTLSANGKTCNSACTDLNCNTCTNTSKCEICNRGYKLNSSNICVKDVCLIVNCIRCDSSSTCLICKQFHILSNNNKSCVANCSDVNCALCSSQKTCSSCIDGYKIVNGVCQPICSINNCSLCASTLTCLSCNIGFVLAQNDQQCDYDCGIYKCLFCNSTSTCQLCYTGFNLVNATVCVVDCQEGLFRNSSTQRCQSCPGNCASCSSQQVCLKCKYLFYLNDTDLSCYSCSNISNCFSCNAADNCQICNNGYYLVNKVCQKHSSNCSIKNCLVCSSGTTCSVCQQTYQLTNSSSACSKIICSSVGQYLVGSTCTCGPKSYTQNGQCVSCNDFNCLSCTNSVCFQCASGYYVSGVSCLACATGCQTCDASSCSSCSSGFARNGKRCVQSSSNRQTSVSRRGTQIKCVAGCKTCDIDSKQSVVCLSADTGFVLVAGSIFKCDSSCLTCANIATNGAYTTCLTCPNGYNLISGICTQCTGQNALTCSNTNFSYSTSCLPGYNAEDGVCNSCSSHCLKCGSTGSGKCDTGGCNFGFFQSQGQYQCIKCFNGCLACGTDPNQCLDCGDYKYLQNKICYSCSDNCVKCLNSSSCTICKTGYGVGSDGSCKALNIVGCTEYDSNISCIACDQNYNLTNGTCAFNITCNANNTCTSCQYNYYLQNGSCLLCPNISNCNSCDQLNSSSCIDCVSGYYLDSSKMCVVCTSNCLTCTSDNICTSAANGYYLILDISGTSTGKVKQCSGLCQTCKSDALICLSCKPGSSFTGSQCISTRNYKVKYVGYLRALGSNSNQSANYQVGFLIGVLSNFLNEIATKALKFSSLSLFIQNSNIQSVKYQSVAVAFSTNADSVSSDPTVSLQNTQFTDMSLISLNVANNSTADSNVNLGLVLGISIPLGILLITIIIILKMKSSKPDSEQKVGQSQKDLEYDEAQAI